MLFRFQIARFGLVGIAATLVHASILSLLIELLVLPVQFGQYQCFCGGVWGELLGAPSLDLRFQCWT